MGSGPAPGVRICFHGQILIPYFRAGPGAIEVVTYGDKGRAIIAQHCAGSQHRARGARLAIFFSVPHAV